MSIGGQWMNLLTDAINTFLKNIGFKGIMRNCAPMWNVEQTVKIPYGQRTVEFAVQIFGEEPVRMVSQTPQIPVLSIRRWSLLEAASDPLFPLSSFSSSDVATLPDVDLRLLHSTDKVCASGAKMKYANEAELWTRRSSNWNSMNLLAN